jgi:hypothetical protein
MGRMSTQTLDYSGPEVGSMSSVSDGARISQLSLAVADAGLQSGSEAPRPSSEPPRAPTMQRNESGLSQHDQLGYPRVIWHGYLYRLTSRGGVKQWRKYWMVVRSTNIGCYKTKEVSFSSAISLSSCRRYMDLTNTRNIEQLRLFRLRM